ncbi:MAG TPA: ankyrin repeat domain-containing protein [bacterium]|nr:ankyrin repeat domain-containing protein [bacterium]
MKKRTFAIAYLALVFFMSCAISSSFHQLRQAIKENDVALITKYLEAGGDPNISEEVLHSSILDCAIWEGNLEIAELLLKKGADPFARSDKTLFSSGNDAVCAIAPSKSREENFIRKILDPISDVDKIDCDGDTLLMRAANFGNLPLVQYLVGRHAKINIMGNGLGCSPLSLAISKGSLDTVKFLVENGADVNLRGERCKMPLWIARNWHLPEIVTYLESKGAKEE